jgi:peptidyl-tRNA hydrolase
MDAAAYVLQDFGRDELPLVSEMLTTAGEAIESFVRHGINLTMTRYNGPVEGAAQL